ncbi:Recombinational DNA repair protein R [Candidatus Phytoplasma mali]|uniref:Recombination protein RecR n=1 Tax=Phytoplasma mali (strain AT) TaxID=482235 RepID=RECR_PHYMT|nr:recombination mediator RecR [Candidatus Phytoplasma mali]B3R068.1 RecName: Full=Recombination protein RecR [Candidatus Phytoplasma mali AT]CAP18232.1 Recombinational DNA repair protein R [Candidatus Phytoplasma mali]
MKNSPTVEKLIESFTLLPGVGKKTAERYTFFLINQKNKNKILYLSKHLKELVNNIKSCNICGYITEKNICNFCSDSQRDHSTIMIVADNRDVYCFEKINHYHGLYHILGGLIDFSRCIKPENLNFNSLKDRLKTIKEIIIATNSTLEGEITATYSKKFLKKYLKDEKIKITKLAYGIPIGLDFNYLDEKTLCNAINNRNNFKGENE